MKILIMHWGRHGGGPQLQRSIAEAMVEQYGAEGVLLTYDRSSEVAASLRALPCAELVVGGGPRRFAMARRLIGQPLDVMRLLAFCRTHRVSVVYEAMDHPLQRIPTLVVRALLRIPVLVSVHDAVRHTGEESNLLDACARVMVAGSDGVMTYSRAVADQLPSMDRPVFVTRHGAFGQASSAERSLSEQPTVGFFGRINRYKGLGRLADAMRVVHASRPGVRVCVVGSGELDPDIAARLHEVNAEIVNRWVTPDEIDGYIASFDVLALPYDDASQSGVVGFAFRHGVPVVSTPVGGLAEQVAEAGGVVAKTMDAGAFAAAIMSLLDDPEHYSAVSQRQRAAVDLFSWSRVAQDIHEAAAQIEQRRA